ncbi:MAG: glycosyltransferase family 2 protein [Nanoarchaeota archaeon]|nr:glycosyltransferase family 2 protein [Nanoarchaeota archaeon]
MMKEKQISVIIPSYNPDIDDLVECIDAVRFSSLKPKDIILVDDGSKTDYIDKVKKYCEIIKNKKNMGPAYTRNTGAKRATGQILCFIDTDVKIKKATLRNISEKFSNSKIHALQTLYSDDTPAKDFFSQYQNLYQHFNFRSINHKYLTTLSSYCIAIKKDAFFDAGGFDESVKKASIEDENLGISLYSKGYKIFIAKDIQVVHLARFNFKKLIKRMFMMGRDRMKYSNKKIGVKKMKFSKTHHSKKLVFSILLSPLIFLSIFLLFFTYGWITLFLLIFIFIIINSSFFSFIFKKRRAIFMFRSIITYYVVCLSVFFGLIKGILEHC